MSLKNLREQKGMKQIDVAKKIGISQPTLSTYEIGTRQPDNDTLIKLADFFKVSTDTILCRNSFNIDFSKFSESHCAIMNKISNMNSMQCEKILSYIDGLNQN